MLAMIGFVTLAFMGIAASSDDDFFEKEVRPILVDRCQKCHGPNKQNGGLRLDSRAGLLQGGDSGPAVRVDRWDQSLLLRAIRRDADVSAMPPKEPLPQSEIEKLSRWVNQGAAWADSKPVVPPEANIAALADKHWAFQPIQNPVAPKVQNPTWAWTIIDRFILAAMESHQLKPAPDARRETLIRRASYDLIGLPPTIAEIDAFLADPDPTPVAFSRVIERLLGSPQYGERWGRHWLDVARYADTKGYVFTEERRYPYSYTYRDWVVRALNKDMPFDQFVIAQIAADSQAQSGSDMSNLAAMGFLTVGRRFLQDINEITDDRIDVVTRGLMGLTVSCARCHDHKYDPIPMDDYYSLYGVFMSSEEPKELPVIGSPTESAAFKDFERRLAERQGAVDQYITKVRGTIEQQLRVESSKWLSLALEIDHKPDHPKISEWCRQRSLPQGGFRQWLAKWNRLLGQARSQHHPVLSAWLELSTIPDQEFAKSSSGHIARLLGDSSKPLAAPLRTALAKPVTSKSELAQVFGDLIARSVKDADVAKHLGNILNEGGPFSLSKDDVRPYFNRKHREELKRLEREVEALKAKHPGAVPRAMVMVDRPRPVEPHIMIRGNPGRLGKQVPRQFLKFLEHNQPKPFVVGSGRMELAQAIVRRDNPLTSRVMVNRIWAWHFGKGFAPSPSDFGLRSEPPSHPELLDHLAHQFITSGWSIKQLHRAIMNSHVYQQSSATDRSAMEHDPENRWLCRFPRQRLDWESLRDTLLVAAGNIDRTMGGRSEPLFEGNGSRRRTLYGFVDRQNLEATYRTFDFASPDATSPKRFVTTVPQQSLFLMNHPFVIRQAELMARRFNSASLTNIDTMFRTLFSRHPTDQEHKLLQQYVSESGKEGWVNLAHALVMSNEFSFVD